MQDLRGKVEGKEKQERERERERDKENLEKGVIGFEKLSYISSCGRVRLCAGM